MFSIHILLLLTLPVGMHPALCAILSAHFPLYAHSPSPHSALLLASSLNQLLYFHLSSNLFCYYWNLSPLALELLYLYASVLLR
jgi:hypothetical protein